MPLTNARVCIKLILLIFVGLHASAQDYTQAQNRIKSIYVYNFIKDIEWPELLVDEEIRICLLRKTDFFNELERLAASKKVRNKSLALQQISSIRSCKACDLIFIEEASAGLERNNECGSLIVTSGFYDKSLSNIALMFEDNKLQFSINQPLCDKNDVKISSHLAALANTKIIQR